MAFLAIVSNLISFLKKLRQREHAPAPANHSNQGQSENSPALSDEERLQKLKSESFRLRTFNDAWEKHCPGVPAYKMARAGFFYVNEADWAQCVFCLGVIYGFRPGDDPEEIHKRVFEECPFVLGKEVGNEPIQQPMNLLVSKICEEAVDKFMIDLGVIKKKSPSFPDMQTYGARLGTFKKHGMEWPNDNCLKKLAKAGFFYSGTNDTVLCYQCEYKLSNWECKEDPWVAHARTNQHCHHVSFMKGPKFASSIFGKHDKREPTKYSAVSADLDSVDAGFSNGSSEEADGSSNEEAEDYGYVMEDVAGLLVHGEPHTKVSSRKMSHAGSETDAKSFKCLVCMDNLVTIVLLPCHHLCSCKACTVLVAQCPLCQTDIKATVECSG